jgi:hypothetical protein
VCNMDSFHREDCRSIVLNKMIVVLISVDPSCCQYPILTALIVIVFISVLVQELLLHSRRFG